MKLQAQTYISPILTEGTFENVFIEETKFEVKRKDKYFAITFEMYCFKNEQRVLLDTSVLAFLGMNNDEVNSNRKTIIQYEHQEETIQVGMID
jgi:hypothetical protein